MKRVEDHNIYILHTYAFKETSLIVEALSENFGRISLLAKGARRPRSLLRGYLQPFQMIQATWSNVSDLKTLYNVEWNSKYLGLKNQALICGFYMNELIMKLLPKDESSNDFFHFYHQQLEELSLNNGYESLLRVFELKLLEELGYKVKLDEDENGNPINPKKFYYYEAEYGASLPDASTNGVKIIGQTLIDMHNNDYSHLNTLKESKLLMRYLMRFYTGHDPVKSKELFLTNDR